MTILNLDPNLLGYFSSINLTLNSVLDYINIGDFSNTTDAATAVSFLNTQLTDQSDSSTLISRSVTLTNNLNPSIVGSDAYKQKLITDDLIESDPNSSAGKQKAILTNLNPQITGTPAYNLSDIVNNQLPKQNSILKGITDSVTQQTNIFNNIKDIEIPKQKGMLDGIKADISQHQQTYNTINNQISELQTKLDSVTVDMKKKITDLLQKDNVTITDIKNKLDQFNNAQLNLSKILENPTIHLYSTGTFKKLIPFKKKIKIFLTLNGKEQWKAPLKASNFKISGLVSSKTKQNSKTPEYDRAGRWRTVTKYFKPKLGVVEGRWYLELDARKINDFPSDYFDEFVIRHDDPNTWSGEVLHWSWTAANTTITDANSNSDLMTAAANLSTIMNTVVDALQSIIGDVNTNNIINQINKPLIDKPLTETIYFGASNIGSTNTNI